MKRSLESQELNKAELAAVEATEVKIPDLSEQAKQFMSQCVFAPLNSRLKPVAALPKFGAFTFNACMFDTGGYLALLPWPLNPDDTLWDMMMDRDKYAASVQAGRGGVSGEHPTLELAARDEKDYFAVEVQGLELGKLSTLRFMITPKALIFLKARGQDVKGITVGVNNLPYAIIGQTTLKSVYSIQFGSKGMLLFKPHLFKYFFSILDPLIMVDKLSSRMKSDEQYHGLKDLYEEDIHGVEEVYAEDGDDFLP